MQREGKVVNKTMLKYFIVFLFVVPLVYSLPQDYLNEFNYGSQICHINDSIYYIDSNNEYSDAILYRCCDNYSLCEEILFDTKKEREFKVTDLEEIYNDIHLRDLVVSGKISPNDFQLDTSNGVCEYFGFDVLRDESIAFVAENEKYVKKSVQAKQYISVAKGMGKTLGLIKEFNPGTFVVSIACNGFSKNEEEIAINLAECKQYFYLVSRNTAHYGLNQKASYCVANVQQKLKTYCDSALMQLKAPVDAVANAVTGVLSWATGDPVKNQLDIKEPTYFLFKKTYGKLAPITNNLKDIQTSSKTQRVITSLNMRKSMLDKEYTALNVEKDKVEGIKPNAFSVITTNLFFEPNYNFSVAEQHLTVANNQLDEMNSLGSLDKFNSALLLKTEIASNLNISHTSLNKEIGVVRVLDIMAVVISCLLITGMVYLGKKVKDNIDNYY